MIAELMLLALSTGTVPANIVCDKQFPVGNSFIPYCTNSKPGPAVFVIHGTDRNVRDYIGYMADVDTLVIAPEFQESAPGLYWTGGWREGGLSQDAARVSSFEVLDRMVEMFHGVAVVGHSAGGQFVTRYAAGTRLQGLTFIAANPGSYMYLNRTRPLSAVCSRFNEYRYGLEDLNTYMSAGVAPDYPDRNVIYLLGSRDTRIDSNLDTSCAARMQGRNRYDRGLNFYRHLAAHFGRPVHRQVVVTGVGHDPKRMLQAAKAYLPE
jgi:pimeloyl-ACP methyl ester carboxylesterase